MSALFEAGTRVDDLQRRYVDALDRKDMPGWLATFSANPDASYICTTAESVEGGLPVSMMLDDCRSRLEDRVGFIQKIWAGTYQDYRTRHFVQRTLLEPEGGLWRVRSNFMLVCTPLGRDQKTMTITGVYEDLVELEADAARFRSKRAVADEAVLPRYLVYPV